VLDGSSDGNAWTGLDERDTRELDADYVTKTFTRSGPQFLRVVRLRSTEKDGHGSDYLVLSQLELFGALREGA